MNIRRNIWRTRGIVAAVAALSTMTGATGATGANPTPAEALNRYIIGLPALVAGPASDAASGLPSSSTEMVGKTKYQCQTTPKTLTANPSDVIALNADAGKLWLGGLLQGTGYAGGPGSLAELPIRDRAPLTIYTDLPGKHISRTVRTPTGATVQQAINDLVADAEKANIQPAAAYDYQSSEAHSTEQALLNTGISVKYLGAKASASLTTNHTAAESSLLVTITQRMFTVKVVKPATPAGYFGPKYTVQDLKQQEAAGRIGPSNPPVVVSHIVYGRKLIYTVTAKSSADNLQATLKAAYDSPTLSGEANLTAEQKATLSTARYGVVAVGGDESAARNLIANHAVAGYLAKGNSLRSAVPIAYQVDNIVNDTAAAFSETTNYNLTACSVAPAELVGTVVRLDSMRGHVAGPCKSPALYGALYINGTEVWKTNDTKPYAGPAVLGDFEFPNLKLASIPKAALDPKYKVTLGANEFPFFKTSGSSPITISGNVTQSVWFGHYPVNLYDAKITYPVTLGENVIQGGSAHCKVNLKVHLSHVADLKDNLPDDSPPISPADR